MDENRWSKFRNSACKPRKRLRSYNEKDHTSSDDPCDEHVLAIDRYLQVTTGNTYLENPEIGRSQNSSMYDRLALA